jgi:hypothetical protein
LFLREIRPSEWQVNRHLNCAGGWPMDLLVRIHIVCPSDKFTGSAESLHQFGRAAATLGYDTRIAYLPNAQGPVPGAFADYGLTVDQEVADEPGVLVVAQHTDLKLVAGLRRAQPAVWWLRVGDDADPATTERALAVPDAVHLAQSEHARRYLELRGVSARVVGDFVPARFTEKAGSLAPPVRLDAVLYNPDRSDAFVPQLIEASRGVLGWVPVSGLKRAEVAELMSYSKVYVDFGAHAGRTRLPREALAAGCCVISGRRGAAGNGVDLTPPEGFAFDETEPAAAKAVLDRIALTVMEFDEAQAAFAPERAAVLDEERVFSSQVAELLAEVRPELMWRGAVPALVHRRRRRPLVVS